MNKTTEALKHSDSCYNALRLAEEALDELRYANDTEIAKTKYYKALAAIRAALAVERSEEALAEPVKQEPVTYIGNLNEFTAFNLVADGYELTDPLYAAPVDAKAIRAEADIELQREIVRLQAIIDEQRSGAESIKKNLDWVRAEALDEAAKVCEQDEFQIYETAERCAAAIRGLK